MSCAPKSYCSKKTNIYASSCFIILPTLQTTPPPSMLCIGLPNYMQQNSSYTPYPSYTPSASYTPYPSNTPNVSGCSSCS